MFSLLLSAGDDDDVALSLRGRDDDPAGVVFAADSAVRHSAISGIAKDGLTAAEMGTALHAFLEHADFMALAAAKQAGTLETAIPAERDRQVEAKLTATEIA